MSALGAFLWANRAAVGLLLLLGLVWKWHSDQISHAVDLTKSELKTQAEVQARDDLIAAQGAWIANTSMLTTLAAVDDRALLKRLDAIDTAVRKFKPEYQSHATATPLPVDCFADPERLRDVNAALGH
jgi:hypothetical protein